MNVELEIEDLSLFAKALNNACVSYGDIVYAIYLNCEVSDKFKQLKELPYEELEKRFYCLKNVYQQIENIEKLKGEIKYG